VTDCQTCHGTGRVAMYDGAFEDGNYYRFCDDCHRIDDTATGEVRRRIDEKMRYCHDNLDFPCKPCRGGL
jgi:DnaJ-class molecular chaperone